MAEDVVDGLTQDRRRAIYLALYQIGVRASEEAERRYPTGSEIDPAIFSEQMKQHSAFYESQKKEGRLALIKKYKIDEATIDRIGNEGFSKKWALTPAPQPQDVEEPTSEGSSDAAKAPKGAEQQPSIPSSQHAATLVVAGDNLRAKGNVKGAISFYSDAIKKHPGTIQAKEAAEKIKALGGKPPDPSEHSPVQEAKPVVPEP
jgi:hypothetical protein